MECGNCSLDGDALRLPPSTGERRYWNWRAVNAAPTSSSPTTTSMTGLPGVAAVDEVRAVFGSSIPGLIITADRSPDVLEIVRRRGLHLLKKPVKPAKLRALVSHLLAQGRPRQAAPERRPRCRSADVQLAGGDHRLRAAVDPEFAEDGGDVRLHRRLLNAELVGDDLVRLAASQQLEDAQFSLRQGGDSIASLAATPARTTSGSSAPDGKYTSPFITHRMPSPI